MTKIMPRLSTNSKMTIHHVSGSLSARTVPIAQAAPKETTHPTKAVRTVAKRNMFPRRWLKLMAILKGMQKEANKASGTKNQKIYKKKRSPKM
jgi:hypothetical protein